MGFVEYSLKPFNEIVSIFGRPSKDISVPFIINKNIVAKYKNQKVINIGIDLTSSFRGRGFGTKAIAQTMNQYRHFGHIFCLGSKTNNERMMRIMTALDFELVACGKYAITIKDCLCE